MKVIEAVKYLQKLVVQKYEELENVLIGLFEESINCSNNSPLLLNKLKNRISTPEQFAREKDSIINFSLKKKDDIYEISTKKQFKVNSKKIFQKT